MRKWFVAHRNVMFHALYGVPAVVAMLLDQLRVIDLSPLLSPFFSASGVAAIGTGISVMSVLLHFTDARIKGEPQ